MDKPYAVAVVDTGYFLYRDVCAPVEDRVLFALGKHRAIVEELHELAERVVLAWDDPRGTSRRRSLHQGYKAGRPSQPEGLAEVHARVRAMAAEIGAENADSDGEADDIAAFFALTEPGSVLLASADKDWLMNVSDGKHSAECVERQIFEDAGCTCSARSVHVYRPDCKPMPKDADPLLWSRPGPRICTEHNLRTEGIKLDGELLCPASARVIRDYLALVGDKSDGIPGVKGVGPGRAAAILRACGEASPVGLLLDGREDELRAMVAAAEPRMSTFIEKTIAERAALETTLALLAPLPVEVVLSTGAAAICECDEPF